MRGLAEKGPLTPVRRLLPAAAAALLLLASCKSVPQRAPSEWLGVLPGDATMYVSFSVTGSADLIKKTLKEAGPGSQDIGSLLDMTKRLVCAVTLKKGGPTQFAVVGLGGYPSGLIGLRLGGSKDWKQVSSTAGKYWQWNKAGIQMSIPNNSVMLAANGGIEQLLTHWESPVRLTIPPDAAADMQRADLVLYMPELPGNLTESAAQKGMRLPIQEVWLNATKTKGAYDLSGTMNTGSEKEAKLLTLALRLGIVAWMRSQNVANAAEKLKAVAVDAVGAQVKMAGLRVPDEEIVPLFLSFVKGLDAPPRPAPSPAVTAQPEPAAPPAPAAAQPEPAAQSEDATSAASEGTE